jgi:hypothetical protein
MHSPHDMSLESDCGMIYWQGKTEKLGEKPVPVPICPPQIPHGLTRARTRASAVRGRRLMTWAMARPITCTYSLVQFSSCVISRIVFLTFRNSTKTNSLYCFVQQNCTYSKKISVTRKRAIYRTLYPVDILACRDIKHCGSANSVPGISKNHTAGPISPQTENT